MNSPTARDVGIFLRQATTVLDVILGYSSF